MQAITIVISANATNKGRRRRSNPFPTSPLTCQVTAKWICVHQSLSSAAQKRICWSRWPFPPMWCFFFVSQSQFISRGSSCWGVDVGVFTPPVMLDWAAASIMSLHPPAADVEWCKTVCKIESKNGCNPFSFAISNTLPCTFHNVPLQSKLYCAYLVIIWGAAEKNQFKNLISLYNCWHWDSSHGWGRLLKIIDYQRKWMS